METEEVSNIQSLFDGPITQSINSVFEGLNASVESLDLLKKYYSAHIQSLKADVQHIKLLGMPSPAQLVDIYNPARVSTTIRRRLFTDEWITAGLSANASSNGTKLISGDSYVEDKSKIAILGGPGAGKTTFLRFLALAYADKDIFAKAQLKTPLVPFFIPLPLFSKSTKNLFEYLSDPIEAKTNKYAKAFLTRVLTKGLAVVLLDSLDEVPIADRVALLQKIKDFCSKYPETKVVISCRTADYQADMLDAFHEIEIAKLDKASVQKIVKAWFASETDKAKNLLSIIENDPGISALTETPLLLSLLCIQFRHDLALPKRKVELFNRCSQTLLREWDTTRNFRRDSSYQSLTDQAKERLFEEIAYHFSVDALTFIFPKAKTVELVSDFCVRLTLPPDDAVGMLSEIDSHHGILEQFSQDHYGFSHTSFQEFFAARAIVNRGCGLKVIQKNLDNPDWNSIVEFIVAQQHDADEIIDFLITKSSLKGLTNYPPMAKRTDWLRLLYRCLATGPYISFQTRQAAINHLVQSQFEIARIYGQGGVFPMSQLLADGIRHPYYYQTKRPSLSTALLPFKKLSNEILRTPIPGYPEAAIKSIETIESQPWATESLLRDALFLNLLTPLASTKSTELTALIKKKIENVPNTPIHRVASVTLGNIPIFSGESKTKGLSQ